MLFFFKARLYRIVLSSKTEMLITEMPAMPRIKEEGEGFLLVCPTPLPIAKFFEGKKNKTSSKFHTSCPKHLHSKKKICSDPCMAPTPGGKNLKAMVGISSLNIARLGLSGIEGRVFVFFCADLRFPYVFAKKAYCTQSFVAQSLFFPLSGAIYVAIRMMCAFKRF